MTSKLTKAEREWLKKVQSVINECPSDRIAFYTIGDASINAYDATVRKKIHAIQDCEGVDFCTAVARSGASFDTSLAFNNLVESTAG